MAVYPSANHLMSAHLSMHLWTPMSNYVLYPTANFCCPSPATVKGLNVQWPSSHTGSYVCALGP